MVYYNISAINGTSLDTAYAGIVVIAPWVVPLVLFFEFIIIMLTGVYMQSRRIGFSNIPMWGAIAGLVTTTSAGILTAVTKYVNGQPFSLVDGSTLGICIAVTMGFAVWFLFTDLD